MNNPFKPICDMIDATILTLDDVGHLAGEDVARMNVAIETFRKLARTFEAMGAVHEGIAESARVTSILLVPEVSTPKPAALPSGERRGYRKWSDEQRAAHSVRMKEAKAKGKAPAHEPLPAPDPDSLDTEVRARIVQAKATGRRPPGGYI